MLRVETSSAPKPTRTSLLSNFERKFANQFNQHDLIASKVWNDLSNVQAKAFRASAAS